MLLWRRAARVWKAKGYSHNTAADAIEAKFGRNKGLGRSKLALLVTTQCEPCPPKVADFILNEMAVLNEKTWAEYLREVENGAPEDTSAAPPIVSEPREVREVAEEAAEVVAGTVAGRLDTFGERFDTFSARTDALLSGLGGKLDALVASLRNTLDAFASMVRGKLDTIQADMNHADARLELLEARIDTSEAQRRKDKRDMLRAVWSSCAVGVVVSVMLAQYQRAPTAAPPPAAQDITVNVGWQAGTGASERNVSDDDWLRGELLPSSDGSMGKRKAGRPMPRTPLPGQAVAPCQGSATTLYGACWILTGYQAPCPPDQFQEGQRCYVPNMAETPKPPASETTQPINPEHR